MTYIPKSDLFRKKRFLNRGSHNIRKLKIVKVPLIRLDLENGSIILKPKQELTSAEAKLFSKAEKSKYLTEKKNG